MSAKEKEEAEVKLGRGYDATRVFLRENTPIRNQILKEIKKKLESME